jgi:cobalt-zinc-cadmium efflux system protein
VEIIGGLLTNSVAILSDAIHDFGDSLSIGLSIYLEKVSHKKRDHKFSFGYRRFSLLAALINSLVLIVGSLIILNEAIPRIFSPEDVNVKGMFLLSILGVTVNGVAVLKIKSGKSLNERVITWHLLEDVLGWVAILIVSIVMYFWTLPILDPILSIVITMIIFWNVIKRLRETLNIFLQAVPSNVNVKSIENKITEIEDVLSVHDTHIWSLDGQYSIMSTHIILSSDLDVDQYAGIKKQVKQLCLEYNIQHVTLELETEDEICVYC